MIYIYRKVIFIIVTILFIVILPLAILFSMGYSLNFQKPYLLDYSLTANIETFPLAANIDINDQPTNISTPATINFTNNSNNSRINKISIKKEGYLSETFNIYTSINQNANVRITDLWLLDKDGKNINKNSNGSKQEYLLPNVLLQKDQNDTYFAHSYGIGGFDGDRQQIKTENKIENIDGLWQPLGENTYFNFTHANLLYKINGQWYLLNLQQSWSVPATLDANKNSDSKNTILLNKIFELGVKNTLLFKPNQILLLGHNKQLWYLDILNRNLTLIQDNISDISTTNDNKFAWLRIDDSLYRMNLNGEIKDLYNKLIFSSDILTQLDVNCAKVKELYDKRFCNTEVLPFFQGNIVRIGEQLIFISDINPNRWIYLTNDVVSATTFEDTIFWINKTGGIYSWNFNLEKSVFLGKVGLDNTKEVTTLRYNSNWKRLLIYNQTKVTSVWFDKYLLNDNLISYYPQIWHEDKQCLNQIYDKVQYCLYKDGTFKVYQNFNLF
jgi:hypothetical protein